MSDGIECDDDGFEVPFPERLICCAAYFSGAFVAVRLWWESGLWPFLLWAFVGMLMGGVVIAFPICIWLLGSGSGHARLGRMFYRRGPTIENYRKALVWQYRAARRGHRSAAAWMRKNCVVEPAGDNVLLRFRRAGEPEQRDISPQPRPPIIWKMW